MDQSQAAEDFSLKEAFCRDLEEKGLLRMLTFGDLENLESLSSGIDMMLGKTQYLITRGLHLSPCPKRSKLPQGLPPEAPLDTFILAAAAWVKILGVDTYRWVRSSRVAIWYVLQEEARCGKGTSLRRLKSQSQTNHNAIISILVIGLFGA